MKYFIVDSEDTAKMYSQACYKLSRPISDNEDITKYLFGIIKHPTENNWAICIDESIDLPISREADFTYISTLFPDATELERLNIINAINNSETVSIADIIPQSIKDQLICYNDLNSQGWFI